MARRSGRTGTSFSPSPPRLSQQPQPTSDLRRIIALSQKGPTSPYSLAAGCNLRAACCICTSEKIETKAPSSHGNGRRESTLGPAEWLAGRRAETGGRWPARVPRRSLLEGGEGNETAQRDLASTLLPGLGNRNSAGCNRNRLPRPRL